MRGVGTVDHLRWERPRRYAARRLARMASEGMAAPAFYAPVERGLEIRIGEKLEELRRLNEAAKNRR